MRAMDLYAKGAEELTNTTISITRIELILMHCSKILPRTIATRCGWETLPMFARTKGICIVLRSYFFCFRNCGL
ncbi:MAG: hypothetical protein GX469_03550 [Treponema sp.]|nr:hypothetical protein [Treponema sp.]